MRSKLTNNQENHIDFIRDVVLEDRSYLEFDRVFQTGFTLAEFLQFHPSDIQKDDSVEGKFSPTKIKQLNDAWPYPYNGVLGNTITIEVEEDRGEPVLKLTQGNTRQENLRRRLEAGQDVNLEEMIPVVILKFVEDGPKSRIGSNLPGNGDVKDHVNSDKFPYARKVVKPIDKAFELKENPDTKTYELNKKARKIWGSYQHTGALYLGALMNNDSLVRDNIYGGRSAGIDNMSIYNAKNFTEIKIGKFQRIELKPNIDNTKYMGLFVTRLEPATEYLEAVQDTNEWVEYMGFKAVTNRAFKEVVLAKAMNQEIKPLAERASQGILTIAKFRKIATDKVLRRKLKTELERYNTNPDDAGDKIARLLGGEF